MVSAQLTGSMHCRKPPSLDHLVGDREQAIRHLEPERLRGLQVDHQLEPWSAAAPAAWARPGRALAAAMPSHPGLPPRHAAPPTGLPIGSPCRKGGRKSLADLNCPKSPCRRGFKAISPEIGLGRGFWPMSGTRLTGCALDGRRGPGGGGARPLPLSRYCRERISLLALANQFER
jgi:hypothetical protein